MPKNSYHTRQGEAVFAYLEVAGHASADELYAMLRANGMTIGRTTVWRQLEKLVESGLAQKYTGAPGASACYQYVGDAHDCDSHFHLKCTSCGRLIHLECEHMAEIEAHVSEAHGFRVDRFRTVFFGECKDCFASERKPKD